MLSQKNGLPLVAALAFLISVTPAGASVSAVAHESSGLPLIAGGAVLLLVGMPRFRRPRKD